MIVIWAGTKGYLDKVPVARVREFEKALLKHVHDTHAEIPKAIRDAREVSADNEKALHATIGGFVTQFLEGRAADPRAMAKA